MASLLRIEKHLGIKIGDMIRCKGKNKEDKNEYYYLEGKYVIIQLSGALYNKWIITDDSKETFKLLENHIYFYFDNTREGFTNTHNGIESWGCMRMGYEVKHKNECLYDNLPKNLKIIRPTHIRVPKELRADNKSGYEGVYKSKGYKDTEYWTAFILVDRLDGTIRRKTKSFNIGVLGYDEARKQAIIKRHEFEKLYG